MNREQRRAQQAEQAAKQAQALASEAGRVLQQRAQERTQPEAPAAEEKPQRPEGWRPNPRNDVRAAARAEIEEREKAQAKEASPAFEPEKPEVKAEQPEQPAQQEAAPVAEPKAEEQPQPDATPKTVKVKIYGEEKEVPQEEVEEYGGVKGYQIAMAAKKDREELKAQLELARQTQQLFAQHLAAQKKPQEPQQSPEQAIAALMDEIRFGTQEQAAAALVKASQLMNKTPDENSIITKATVNFKHDSAQQKFNTEFADVLATPEMKQFAVMLNQQTLSQYMVQGQPNWQALATVDFDNHYRTIGNRIRSMLGGKTQPAASVVTSNTSASDKEAKKASIVNLPTASARAALPAEEKPETREEILNRARKARGQLVS